MSSPLSHRFTVTIALLCAAASTLTGCAAQAGIPGSASTSAASASAAPTTPGCSPCDSSAPAATGQEFSGEWQMVKIVTGGVNPSTGTTTNTTQSVVAGVDKIVVAHDGTTTWTKAGAVVESLLSGDGFSHSLGTTPLPDVVLKFRFGFDASSHLITAGSGAGAPGLFPSGANSVEWQADAQTMVWKFRHSGGSADVQPFETITWNRL